MEFRDFQSPEYKKWRKAVFIRDLFCCRKCGSKTKIQAHHIKRWADFPTLRFVVTNGITLCECCHSLVKDREAEFEPLFASLICQKPKFNRDAFIAVRMAMRKR